MDEALAKKIDDYFTQFKHQLYKKGEILIRADDDPQGIFYIKSGIVKKYAISKKGDEIIVNLFKPVSFFPMSWALNNTPNAYYYEAVTDVELWRVPRDKVVAFVKENPDVLYDLMCRVYRGTEGLLTRMTYLMSGNAYDRLITEVLINAKRFGVKGKDGVSIEIHVSEKDIASQAGMTRETVSREMKRLKDNGLITLNKSILIIYDLSKLEDELSSDS